MKKRVGMIAVNNCLSSFLKLFLANVAWPTNSVGEADLDGLSFVADSLRHRALNRSTDASQDERSNLLALASMLSGSIKSLRGLEKSGLQNTEIREVSRSTIQKVAKALIKWSQINKDPEHNEAAQQASA